MIQIYVIIFLICLWIQSKRDINFSNSFSPTVLFLSVMLIYTIFGGLFIINKTSNKEIHLSYWLIQIISLLGVLMSIVFNKFSLSITIIRKKASVKMKFIFIFLVILHFYLYINKYGGIDAILSTGYKLVYEKEETNLLNFSILGLLASFSLVFNFHKYIFVSSLLFFLIAISLGTRGMAISFLSIPFMSYYLDKKRFSYIKVIYFIPILIFFLVVAYVRNIGFANVQALFSLDYDFFYSLFIENSEFNTTGLVIFTGLTNPNWYTLNFFEYFFGFLSAIIPRSLWLSRPDAISNIFSNKFAPIGEGIGFSVGYEAYIILGYIGPLIYFFILQMLIQKLYSSKNFVVNSLILFSPLLILWVNRIDLQTIFKVSLVYILYCLLWRFFIKLVN